MLIQKNWKNKFMTHIESKHNAFSRSLLHTHKMPSNKFLFVSAEKKPIQKKSCSLPSEQENRRKTFYRQIWYKRQLIIYWMEWMLNQQKCLFFVTVLCQPPLTLSQKTNLLWDFCGINWWKLIVCEDFIKKGRSVHMNLFPEKTWLLIFLCFP